jgi:hypothetical protein
MDLLVLGISITDTYYAVEAEGEPLPAPSDPT